MPIFTFLLKKHAIDNGIVKKPKSSICGWIIWMICSRLQLELEILSQLSTFGRELIPAEHFTRSVRILIKWLRPRSLANFYPRNKVPAGNWGLTRNVKRSKLLLGWVKMQKATTKMFYIKKNSWQCYHNYGRWSRQKWIPSTTKNKKFQ